MRKQIVAIGKGRKLCAVLIGPKTDKIDEQENTPANPKNSPI